MRPTGLTIVCVLGFIFATLGFLGVATGCMGLMAQSMFMDMALAHGDDPSMEAMQQGMLQVNQRWLPFSIASLVLNGVASILLLIGGIMGFRMSPRAHVWLAAAFGCALLQTVLYAGVQFALQREMQPIMTQQMSQAMQQAGTTTPQARAVVSGSMRLGYALGVAIPAVWALLQIGCYAASLAYVLQKDVRRLFASDTLGGLAAQSTVDGGH
jgi:hypothetical protein